MIRLFYVLYSLNTFSLVLVKKNVSFFILERVQSTLHTWASSHDFGAYQLYENASNKRQYWRMQWARCMKVRKRAKIRNRYNQSPRLTQDANGKVTTSQFYITNESQMVSPFPAGDHKASINIRARKHSKGKTEITQMIINRSTALERSFKIFYWTV